MIVLREKKACSFKGSMRSIHIVLCCVVLFYMVKTPLSRKILKMEVIVS